MRTAILNLTFSLGVFLLTLPLVGCSEAKKNPRTAGTIGGAAAGAAVGAAVDKDNRAEGAIIGGLIGGAAGNVGGKVYKDSHD